MNVSQPLIQTLRDLGHDVLTAQATGQGNQRIPDPPVLTYAHRAGRTLVTDNRRDFALLRMTGSVLSGITVCADDRDRVALARRIGDEIGRITSLAGTLVRVNRPAR